VLNAGVDDAKKWIPAYTSLGAKHENRWNFANYGGLTGLSHLTIGQVRPGRSDTTETWSQSRTS
jgi:hypothetical protein